jgi:tetratricopeptide (TPR) repeat protein
MDENTVQFGTGGSEPWWRRLTKRWVIIPFFALIFIGVGVWVFLSLKSTSEDKGTTIENIVKASDAAIQSGDYQKSLDQLRSATEDAKSKEEKIILYSNLAAASASAGNMPDALRYLEEKHKIAPETRDQDAYLLGTYYERSGDTDKALEYYKMALRYRESQEPTEGQGNGVESLKDRIRQLEASQ